MSVTVDVTVRQLILDLKKKGFSYRALAKVLGVSHEEVRRWALGLYRPKNPHYILRRLSSLIVDDRLELVDDYYSPTHNGPPNNYFSIRPGDNHLIERFKRSIKLMADFLDIQNSKLLDYAAEIGIKYLRENNNLRLYGVQLRSFALACIRIVMYQHHYVYPEWDERLQFITNINLVDSDRYLEFFTKLSERYLA